MGYLILRLRSTSRGLGEHQVHGSRRQRMVFCERGETTGKEGATAQKSQRSRW